MDTKGDTVFLDVSGKAEALPGILSKYRVGVGDFREAARRVVVGREAARSRPRG